MRFAKVESIGNDFVLMEGPLADPSAIALKTSSRRWSIGSDGLLVIERPVDNIVPLRMFNPDGTEDFWATDYVAPPSMRTGRAGSKTNSSSDTSAKT